MSARAAPALAASASPAIEKAKRRLFIMGRPQSRASAADSHKAAQIWDGLATIARPGRRGANARAESPIRAACKAPRKIAMLGA
jgi:hypothetical protein